MGTDSNIDEGKLSEMLAKMGMLDMDNQDLKAQVEEIYGEKVALQDELVDIKGKNAQLLEEIQKLTQNDVSGKLSGNVKAMMIAANNGGVNKANH